MIAETCPLTGANPCPLAVTLADGGGREAGLAERAAGAVATTRVTCCAKDTITLAFDQPVVWAETLAGQFFLDGAKDQVASGSVAGNVLTLKLKGASAATKITYLKEIAWNQDTLLLGANGIAALTFCEVALQAGK